MKEEPSPTHLKPRILKSSLNIRDNNNNQSIFQLILYVRERWERRKKRRKEWRTTTWRSGHGTRDKPLLNMELEIINSSGELCLYGFFCKQLVMLHLCNILHKYLITNFGELIHIGPGLAKLLVNGFWYGTLDKWYRIYIDILFVDKKK